MFYDMFEALCKEKKISANKACIEMGLSRSIAAKWKLKGSTPTVDVIKRVAKYFGVSYEYLMTFAELDEKSSTLKKELDVDGVSDAYGKLNEEGQKMLRMYLEFLQDKFPKD